VKFWTARNPGGCSVGRNAKNDITSAAICPATASLAALLCRPFGKLKITNETANGTAEINQK
jgi:hypothetical protein